jgi:uncharacterized beta-barrel protein YwiB (DUF1934 family)
MNGGIQMNIPEEGRTVSIRLVTTVRQPGEKPFRNFIRAEGLLIEKAGRTYLSFEEDGDGQGIRTMVRMGHEEGLIMRNGDVSMRLPLVPGERREGRYGSGGVDLPLTVKTDSVRYEPGPEGRFAAAYHLLSGSETVGTYDVEFTYSEGKA